MACEVKVKDIEKDIKNILLNIFDTARPIKSGSAVFISVNSKNKESILPTIKKSVKDMNSRYNSEMFGEVVSYERDNEFGYTIFIKPTKELSEAMTLQNIRDEIGNDFYMGDQALFEQDEFNSPTNRKKPVTDNFIEYKRYKESLLKKVIQELKQLQRDKKNPKKDFDTTMDKIKRLTSVESSLRHDVQVLGTNTIDYMFETLKKDIIDLNESMDKGRDIETIKDRLSFLNILVKGVDYEGQNPSGTVSIQTLNDPAFNEINLGVDNLNAKYREKIGILRDQLIREDISFYNNVAINSEITPEQVKDMFNPSNDINWLEKTFLGITSSSNNDGIIPQVISSYLNTKATVREAEVKVYMDKLNNLINKLTGSDFEFIFEKTSNGNKTGNIINLYSPLFQKALSKYYQINESEANEADKYRQKIKWLQNNAEVIDFRKLAAVKEVYKDLYPSHFSFTDEQMSRYEASLRETLGPLYEEEISKVLRNLENFQLEQSTLLDETNNPYRFKNVATIDPWAFINHYNSPLVQGSLAFNSGGINTEHTIPSISNIRFIPNKEDYVATNEHGDEIYQDSGYYNPAFNEILSDPVKLEYWSLMKEIYSDYVNPVYGKSGMSQMSYAKMEEEWLEAIQSAKGLSKGTAFLKNTGKEFKKFFYERGYENNSQGIRKDYQDTSRKEVREMIIVLMASTEQDLISRAKEEGINVDGMQKADIAKELALKSVMSHYSTDINKVTGALLNMSAALKAKEDVAPIARLLTDAHKLSNPDRQRSIEKLNNWVDRVIFNQSEKYRGSASFLGKDITKNTFFGNILDKLGQIPFINKFIDKQKARFLTDSEKTLLKELEEVKKKGPSGEDMTFAYKGTTFILDQGQYYKTVKDAQGRGVGEVITEQDFDDNFQEFIEDKVSNLGLDLSTAGIIQGMLKTIIFKGLGLNPISGIFNRIEGKNSGLIMDQTGKFWTKGNIQTANNFMAFANFIKFLPERFTPAQNRKIQELQKMRVLLQNINLIQDRKNELERASETSKFDYAEVTNIYQWAVENPEFKNQGAILLSILMDTNLKDIDGNSSPIFDGKEFVIWDNVDGKLVLKPQFRTESNISNWENFEINEKDIKDNQFFLTKQKIRNAISRSQGNYDNLDVIDATKNIWGRSFTLFMKWMPEHAMQRFASGEGTDLTTGKAKIKGRYRYLMQNTPAALTTGVLTAVTAFGMTPVTGLVALGWSGFVAARYFKNLYSKDALKQETLNTIDFIAFAKSIVINTLNYPLELVNVKDKLISQDALDNVIPGYSKTNLSQEEINNLQAVAKELGVKLTFIALLILAKSLTWDDDDEKDSDRRKFHNFTDNQITRFIGSISNWTNPEALASDVQRLAFLQYLWDTSKLLKSIAAFEDAEKVKENAFKASPLPRMLYKGQAPWLDDKEYEDKDWFDKWIKATGKKGAFMEYRDSEKERITKELESKGLSGENLEKQIKSKMRKEVASKSKNQTYTELLDELKSGKSGTQINKERRAKATKKGHQDK